VTARRELPLGWVAAMLVVGALFTLSINAVMGGTVGTAPQRSADEIGKVRVDREPARARGAVSSRADNPRRWRKDPTESAGTPGTVAATAAGSTAVAAASAAGTQSAAGTSTTPPGTASPQSGAATPPAVAPQGTTGSPAP
jgi:hypothetical protein